MDGIGSRFPRGSDDICNVQIALLRLRAADRICLIRLQHVFRFEVGIRIDSNSLDFELLACSDYPESDLSTVCDENLPEHDPRPRLQWNVAMFSRGTSFSFRLEDPKILDQNLSGLTWAYNIVQVPSLGSHVWIRKFLSVVPD